MSTPSGGPLNQGGRSEVHIGLPLATIYDLNLARRHLQRIAKSSTEQLFLDGDAILALEHVLSVLDSLVETVRLVQSNRRNRAQSTKSGPSKESST